MAGDDPDPPPDAPTLVLVADPTLLLYEARDCPVVDYAVNNVDNSVGTLRAHDYWDNAADFIPRLITLLEKHPPTGVNSPALRRSEHDSHIGIFPFATSRLV